MNCEIENSYGKHKEKLYYMNEAERVGLEGGAAWRPIAVRCGRTGRLPNFSPAWLINKCRCVFMRWVLLSRGAIVLEPATGEAKQGGGVSNWWARQGSVGVQKEGPVH